MSADAEVQGTLTDSDRALLALVRLNRETPRKEFRRKWTLGHLEATFEWRSKSNLWGRFGGGWNWKLGIQSGGRTVIVSLLIASLTLTWRERDAANA